MENLDWEAWLEQAKTIFLAADWWYWAGGGVLLLVLILVLAFRNSGKKRKAREVAPRLGIHAFQLSPLGRDAFLKVRNDGQAATISNLQIKGRKDITVKNAFAGHRLEPGKVYSLLLEANGKDKIKKDFLVEITYLDQVGNVYKQSFPISKKSARSPKLVRYA